MLLELLLIFLSVILLASTRENVPILMHKKRHLQMLPKPLFLVPNACTFDTGPFKYNARSISWIIKSNITSTSVIRLLNLLVRVRSILIALSLEIIFFHFHHSRVKSLDKTCFEQINFLLLKFL